MEHEGQASGRRLALYCVFLNDMPVFSGYTPTFSQDGLLLAISSTLHWLTPGKDVLLFFQDASLPTSLLSSASPYLLPLQHTLDDYLAASPLSRIQGYWVSRSWPWARKHPWWECLLEEEFHATLDSGPTNPPSCTRMFLEWVTDWVPLQRDDYR
jgi:hypothetical protein